MFIGYLQQWEKDRAFFPKAFDTAVSFWADKGPLPVGRHEIRGSDIYMLVQKGFTEPASVRKFELHRDYIDIQVLLSGHEVQQYYLPSPLQAQCAGNAWNTRLKKEFGVPDLPPYPPVLEDKLDSEDVAFYARPDQALSITQNSGMYVIYSPYELHCPMCMAEEPEEIQKVVFKIHKRCL